MPSAAECPVYISLHCDGTSLVKGSPGVPYSLPRIETTIEIRPVNGIAFSCRSIGFELHTEQAVSLPSTLGSNGARKSVKIAGDPMVYAPPVGQFCQEMLALDVPIAIPLDRAIVPSASFSAWGCTTVHYLIVKVTIGPTTASQTSFVQRFAIPIKTYDTLPLYRQYSQPIRDMQISDDNQVQANIVLPVSAVGPQDPFSLSVVIAANYLSSKINRNLSLKLVSLQLKEILECFDGGLPARKESKLYTDTKEFGKHLNTEGVKCEFLLKFPYFNDLLDLYPDGRSRTFDAGEVNHAPASFNRSIIFPQWAEGIPLTHFCGFTLVGKLYALRYELVLKVKISNGKDLEYTLPITVSPYNRQSSGYLIDWIKSECLIARERYGKHVVAKFARSHTWDTVYHDLKHMIPPPSVYYNTRVDWTRLGYSPDAFGRPFAEKAFSEYID